MEIRPDLLEGRCPKCLLRQEVCLCDRVPTVHTRTEVLLVRHMLEALKSSNTARMAALAMPRCTLVDYGLRDAPFDPAPLRRPGTWLLYPGAEPCASPPPGLTQLVVIDGSWSQARRMTQRIPELRALPKLSLPPAPPPPRQLRRQKLEAGMSTLEAIARAISLLEGEDVARPLVELHALHAERSFALRFPVAKERRADVYPSLAED
ncbi:MAG: DTW domain-containing protein [Myxococcales bacterium]